MKEEFLKLKDAMELSRFEDKKREELYNKILSDSETKEHLFKILKQNKEIAEMLNANENAINNILMINGAPPIDDFSEEDW